MGSVFTYTAPAVLPAPVFSVASGTYEVPKTVTISDSTAGVTIYYTTNDATPTTSSTKYTAPIAVSTTETLKAIAVETGFTNSVVASAAYTISPVLQTPVFSVAAGTYPTAQTVSISDSHTGVTIYYTTQRRDANHILNEVHGPNRGEHDGNAQGYRRRNGLY